MLRKLNKRVGGLVRGRVEIIDSWRRADEEVVGDMRKGGGLTEGVKFS